MISHNYKLLVVDIDGTLIGGGGSVSAEDREALARAGGLGMQVSLSTGRVPKACLKIISDLSLDGYHVFFDGALVSNHNQSEEVHVQPISRAVVRRAAEFARLNGISIDFYSATDYFVERETWSAIVHRDFFGIQPNIVEPKSRVQLSCNPVYLPQ